jgi:hypothetical protein
MSTVDELPANAESATLATEQPARSSGKRAAETPQRSRRVKTKAQDTKKSSRTAAKKRSSGGGESNYPRHSIDQALRIPRAILDQNAGRASTIPEAASFVGVGGSGSFRLEVSSAVKYGLLERPEAGKIRPSERARRILRPQSEGDEIESLREAILDAPVISDVYKHYRGENLPDRTFFRNTVTETYGVPDANVDDFYSVFTTSLDRAGLLDTHGGKIRVLDVTANEPRPQEKSERIRKLGRDVKVQATDTCFVMQPFASPYGDYYEKLYKPAIEKAGLTPVRADADIFGTGKIIDQVWRGISAAKVLVADLTTRNPNVFYELGAAHALEKPVVLISSNEEDVPFDLQHIRVIYYNMTDPFWGQKLIEKVAENICLP